LRWSYKQFGQKNLVKSLLISTLDKVIYYIGKCLQGSTKPFFTTQTRLEISSKQEQAFALWLSEACAHTRESFVVACIVFIYMKIFVL
jgi:hypothetical protein